jgi:phosphatidylserine/phosphatidylglycerophosphate/cardiolipin synthase-like enzyme
VWLSSGNWNNSNQPAINPIAHSDDAAAARAGDRDWHVVIEHPGLAAVFEAFIAHDLQVARDHQEPGPVPAGPALPPPGPGSSQTPPYAGFAPAKSISERMTITPVLTPDPGDYTAAIKSLIGSATTSLYMQFQYIHVPKPAPDTQAFADLIGTVIDRQRAGVDVKIIMSEFENTGYLEQLIAAGLDVSEHVKLQNNVHNKGIVVDAATTLISSQNWSADGVLHNRDAGVIIASPTVAGYYQQLFLHDWAHLAHQQTHDD